MQVFTVTPDTAVNINVASNILKGNWFQISEFQTNGLILNRPYFDHPPATSVLMSVFIFFTENEIVGLFASMIFLCICELYVINKILSLQVFRNKRGFLFMALALFTGHLYTGGVADQFAMVLALFIFSNLMYLFEGLDESTPNRIVILNFSLILVPLVKFSLIPLAVASYCVLSWYLIRVIKDRKSSKFLILFSILSGCLTLVLFLFLQNMSSMHFNTAHYFNIDLYNLSKLDYFWMHLGRYIDRVYKHITWNTDRIFGIHIEFWNIAQVSTFVLWCFIVFRPAILNELSFKILLLYGLFQTGYLMFLTVITAPQENVLYGVDDKVWVYVEEARYYNYLSFISFIILTNILVDKFKMAFYFLLCLLVMNLSLEVLESKWSYRLRNMNNCTEILRNNCGAKNVVQGKLTNGEIRSIRIMLGYDKY